MKVVLDESVERQVAVALTQAGHEIWYIADLQPGITDERVLDIANANNALLVTSDKDFGEIVYRKKMISVGVVLLRLFGIPNSDKADIAVRMLHEHGEEFIDSFSVITPESVRIRKNNPDII